VSSKGQIIQTQSVFAPEWLAAMYKYFND